MTATTTTATRPRRPRVPSPAAVVAAIALAAATLMTFSLSGSTPSRRTIRVENETGAPVTVRVTSRVRDGWLGLGTVDPRSVLKFEEVADQGEIWRLELTVGPDHIGEISRTKGELSATGWTVTIPADAAAALPSNRRSG